MPRDLCYFYYKSFTLICQIWKNKLTLQGMIQLQTIEKLFEKRKDQYVAFAFSYLRDHDAAADLFMDAISQLWQGRNDYEEDSNVDALLLTIVKNKSLDYLRHQQKRMSVEQKIKSSAMADLQLRLTALNATTPEYIFSDEIQMIVSQTLDRLPARTRRIFEMSRTEHLTNAEIAQQLNVSVKGVEYQITKCLKALRVALKDYLPLLLLFHII